LIGFLERFSQAHDFRKSDCAIALWLHFLIHENDIPEVLDFRSDLENLSQLKGVGYNENLDTGIVQYVSDMRWSKGWTDRHVNRTKRRNTHIGDNPLRSIFRDDGNLVIPSDTRR
jgi:hypothetical protein